MPRNGYEAYIANCLIVVLVELVKIISCGHTMKMSSAYRYKQVGFSWCNPIIFCLNCAMTDESGDPIGASSF